MILKEFIKKDKKKDIEELSQKSSLLIGKGAVYPNDISYLTSELSYIYNRPDLAPLTFDYVIQPKLFYEYCYKYKYFDTIEKKYIKDCKIYSPFSQFKGNGLEFERFITPKGKDNVSLRLFENNEKIQMIFMLNYQECWDIVNCIYRDLDNLFVKDIKEGKWYGASINLFLEATRYATTRKTEFDVNDFFWNFNEVEKKGTGYVVGNLKEKQKLIIKDKEYL